MYIYMYNPTSITHAVILLRIIVPSTVLTFIKIVWWAAFSGIIKYCTLYAVDSSIIQVWCTVQVAHTYITTAVSAL